MKKNTLFVLSAMVIGVTVSLLTPSAQAQRGGGATAQDSVIQEALTTALTGPHGEYAARAEYAAILEVWPGAQPFANILVAEEKHVAALIQQCQKYGVPVPPDTFWGKVTVPSTLLEAAEIGVLAELDNVAMYDELLTMVANYPSLVRVFTNLRAASLENHLPAFEAAVEAYAP